MMTEAEILAVIRELPREAQWRIRDALPKRRRGRPRADGPTPNYLMKKEAKDVWAALPSDMSEGEKLRAVRKAIPGLGPGVIERLCHNEDSYFRRSRRKAGSA
jgi:hypothetical protein